MRKGPQTSGRCTPTELRDMVDRFVAWLDGCDGATYDPYDVWGTAYGRLARRLYYRRNPLGFALTAPVILMEVLTPWLRSLFVRRNHFPTADAQLALAFLNLHEMSDGDAGWLNRARQLAESLLSQSVSGYSGHCWGYPFDWQNVNGLMASNTPHITATPYCYEVFARLFEITGERRYCEIARSIATFVSDDLNDTATGSDAAASSYTPDDHGKVVNASAYRAFVMLDAGARFGNETYRAKGLKNLQFVLQAQRPDGSWLYAIDNPAEAFIDHFHTCFVLKNLYKINVRLQNPDVTRAIRDGYRWYREFLFDSDGNPRSFAIAPRVQIVQLEMYNVAEAVSLAVLLKDEIPDALSTAQLLAAKFLKRYQLPAGHWVTRTYLGGVAHKVPFLRWPQSQLFLAVTNLLRSTACGDPIAG